VREALPSFRTACMHRLSGGFAVSTARDEDGFGLVNHNRDQTYAIRLINRFPLEMAVKMRVDGFNVFAFSELQQQQAPHKEPLSTT
jgi:hypothetical protein